MEGATQPSELSLTDAVTSLVSELPAPVRDFIQSSERDSIALKLSQKYNLHVDQAGVFQLAYLHMLIGVASPEEFSKTLTDAGISTETVSKLINDVNEEVFKPLRAKEREGRVINQIPPAAPPSPTPATSVVPVVPPPSQNVPQVPPAYAGARPQPLTPFNLPGAEAKPTDLFRSQTRAVAPTPTPVASPQASTPYSAPAALPSFASKEPVPIPPPTPVAPITTPEKSSIPPMPSVSRPQPEKTSIPVAPSMPSAVSTPTPTPHSERPMATGGTLRTMATDMLAVNEHREPAPIQYKGTAYTPPVIMQEAPPQPHVVQGVPPTPASRAEPTPPLSVTLPAQTPMKTVVTPVPSNELVKEYATDPYREAI